MSTWTMKILALFCISVLLIAPAFAGVSQGSMQTQVHSLLEKVRSGTGMETQVLYQGSFIAGVEPQVSGSPYSLLSITYPYHPAAKNWSVTYPYPGPAPTYYPLPVIPTIPTATPIIPSSSRGYGSLQVKTNYEGQLYLWIKSDFFVRDVEPGYDMQWHVGGAIPVYYENNILAGQYYLKATTSKTDDATGVVWCGRATVVEGYVTEVNVVPTACPFGCSCC
jgi:hypothetical protein